MKWLNLAIQIFTGVCMFITGFFHCQMYRHKRMVLFYEAIQHEMATTGQTPTGGEVIQMVEYFQRLTIKDLRKMQMRPIAPRNL